MRITRSKAMVLKRRAVKREAAKTARIAQERRSRRVRRSIDRDAIFQRDKGVCALCGVDTQTLALWLANLPRVTAYAWTMAHTGIRDRFVVGGQGHVLGRHHQRALTLLGRLWGVRLGLGARLFEIDHVTPIAEGGSDDAGNLRTLCRKCHHRETAALKGRLARRPTKSVGRGF